MCLNVAPFSSSVNVIVRAAGACAEAPGPIEDDGRERGERDGGEDAGHGAPLVR